MENDIKKFCARGFGNLIGFGDKSAILVIDFMRSFTSISHPLGSKLDKEIAAASCVLEKGRKNKIPIFFSVVQYDDPNLVDAGLWAKKMTGIHSLRSGSADVQIDPRLNRKENEQIITKKFASAFFGTDLVSRLNYLGIDTLIIVGCTTSGCVRATAVDGVQYGFRCMIVKEAVGDRSINAHEQSLFDLHAKYADVVSLDNVISYLSE